MQKMSGFLASFFTIVLLEEKQKKPIVFSDVFCLSYFSKTKRKQTGKKYREMFSYQFVAHMPKIR